MNTPNDVPKKLLPEPKFGEWLRGIYASETNPHRDGMYVRTYQRSRSVVNPGKFYELTDGEGKFWQYPAQSVERIKRYNVEANDAQLSLSVRLEMIANIHEQRDFIVANVCREAAELARRVEGDECEWSLDESSFAWDSSCGELWQFNDGGPDENNVRFCHGCGKRVRLVPVEG